MRTMSAAAASPDGASAAEVFAAPANPIFGATAQASSDELGFIAKG